MAINDVDHSGERSVYFLTPGLHDQKYSDQYIQGADPEWKAERMAYFSHRMRTPRVLKGDLLAAGVNGRFRFSVGMTDSKGKHVMRELSRANGVLPGELLKIPFEVPAG